MKKQLLRREFLGMGCMAGGFGLAKGAEAALAQSGHEGAMTFPWKFPGIRTDIVKARAYAGYFKAGCMYAVFEAVAGSAADALGKPYTGFPFAMSGYGGGGVASYGSLCGTCNGAAMAISMFHQGDLRTKMIQDVFSWYEGTKLPSYNPETPAKVQKSFVMPAATSGSVLCHVSISRWSKASRFASFSLERTERCARLAADVAGYVAEALNKAQVQYQYTPKALTSEVASGCLGCHAQGKQPPNEPEVVSRMVCTTCHPTAHNQKKF